MRRGAGGPTPNAFLTQGVSDAYFSAREERVVETGLQCRASKPQVFISGISNSGTTLMVVAVSLATLNIKDQEIETRLGRSIANLWRSHRDRR